MVERLAGQLRCIVPDLPLGSHRVADAARRRPRSPRAVAQLIADLIAALDLDDVTLVGNDTGGALCQLRRRRVTPSGSAGSC